MGGAWKSWDQRRSTFNTCCFDPTTQETTKPLVNLVKGTFCSDDHIKTGQNSQVIVTSRHGNKEKSSKWITAQVQGTLTQTQSRYIFTLKRPRMVEPPPPPKGKSS